MRRVKKEDLRRIAKATGATVCLTLASMEGDETFDASQLGQVGYNRLLIPLAKPGIYPRSNEHLLMTRLHRCLLCSESTECFMGMFRTVGNATSARAQQLTAGGRGGRGVGGRQRVALL